MKAGVGSLLQQTIMPPVGVCSGSVLGCSTCIPELMNDPCHKLLEPAGISDGLVISRVVQEMI